MLRDCGDKRCRLEFKEWAEEEHQQENIDQAQKQTRKKNTSNPLDIKGMENFKDSICVSFYCVGTSSLYDSLDRTTDAEQVMFGFVITTPRGVEEV